MVVSVFTLHHTQILQDACNKVCNESFSHLWTLHLRLEVWHNTFPPETSSLTHPKPVRETVWQVLKDQYVIMEQ